MKALLASIAVKLKLFAVCGVPCVTTESEKVERNAERAQRGKRQVHYMCVVYIEHAPHTSRERVPHKETL